MEKTVANIFAIFFASETGPRPISGGVG